MERPEEGERAKRKEQDREEVKEKGREMGGCFHS